MQSKTHPSQLEDTYISINLQETSATIRVEPELDASFNLGKWKPIVHKSSLDYLESTQGLLNPSIDNAYNKAISEIEDIGTQSAHEFLPPNIANLSIGKKPVSPRKSCRRFSFLELKGGKRRKISK